MTNDQKILSAALQSLPPERRALVAKKLQAGNPGLTVALTRYLDAMANLQEELELFQDSHPEGDIILSTKYPRGVPSFEELYVGMAVWADSIKQSIR